MATLTMPTTPGFSRSRFAKDSNTRAASSAFTGRTQTLVKPGALWRATYTLPPMKRATAAPWVAFLMQLEGQGGRFYAYDPDAQTPLGTATGTPLVNGASQTGKSLVTDGWTAGVTGILKAGDYIAYDTSSGRELRMVVSDVNSDGGGNATLTLDAAIRESPANNETIITSQATCIMMLDSDRTEWDADRASIYGITFSGVEAYGS